MTGVRDGEGCAVVELFVRARRLLLCWVRAQFCGRDLRDELDGRDFRRGMVMPTPTIWGASLNLTQKKVALLAANDIFEAGGKPRGGTVCVAAGKRVSAKLRLSLGARSTPRGESHAPLRPPDARATPLRPARESHTPRSAASTARGILPTRCSH